MFENDLEELATVDLLSAAGEFVRIQDRAAVRTLEAALTFADRNAVVEGYYDGGEALPGHERIRVYGGDGCPGVAEFAPVEFGAALRMSSGAAAALIGEALALRHRLPRIWAAVLAGTAVAWRARKIAHACLTLSLEAAAVVDRRVAGIVDSVTPGALTKIVKAAVWEADPDQAKAEAEAAARTRGVFVAPSDDHGTKRFWVRAAAGAVIRFDATIDDLARALKTLGDPDTLDERRAKAIDWISDPAAAHHLLEVARHLARTQPTRPQPTHATGNGTADCTGHAPREGVVASSADGADDDAADAAPATPPSPDAAASVSSGTAARGSSSARTAGSGSASADSGAWSDSREVDGDAFTRRLLAGELAARLAAIKQDAYRNGLGAAGGTTPRSRRNRHTIYVHLTDHTLATGDGVLRVEELGPLLAGQLGELLGHDQVVVKPVIDLHDQVSVHSYEIPDRIRERVRLQHPVDMFPYGAAEATPRMDQDHIKPYAHANRPDAADETGPPLESRQAGQTGTDNLIPLTRLHHRAKTFGGWRNRRLPDGAIEWTSPHGFVFIVDHTGTRPIPPASAALDLDTKAGP